MSPMRALLSSRGPVWRWARAGAEMSRRSQRAFQTGSRLMMPSRFNADLPAFKQLQAEGVWVEAAGAPGQAELEKTMPHVKILILNLMPLKEETDLQLCRMLGRTHALCDVTFVVPDNYGGKNSAPGYLDNFYKRFSEIKGQQFDGVIVTGAPIEHLPFEEVKYWGELQAFLDSVKEMDAGMLSLCWGAMATLWHFHQVPKHMTDRKQFGVFAHRISDAAHALVQAIPDGVGIPVSRHTTWRAADVAKAGGGLAVLLDQSETGPGLVWDAALGHAHMINHFEYDRLTLDSEYRRDVAKGTPTGDAIHVPPNYYTGNDPGRDPIFAWKAAGQVFYSNWVSTVIARKVARASRA